MGGWLLLASLVLSLILFAGWAGALALAVIVLVAVVIFARKGDS